MLTILNSVQENIEVLSVEFPSAENHQQEEKKSVISKGEDCPIKESKVIPKIRNSIEKSKKVRKPKKIVPKKHLNNQGNISLAYQERVSYINP